MHLFWYLIGFADAAWQQEKKSLGMSNQTYIVIAISLILRYATYSANESWTKAVSCMMCIYHMHYIQYVMMMCSYSELAMYSVHMYIRSTLSAISKYLI